MLRAAFTSRWCKQPQFGHSQCLICKPAIPLGPLSARHSEQVAEVNRSSTSIKHAWCLLALSASMFLSIDHPASRTDFAIRVLASLAELTLPTTLFSRAILVDSS